MAADSIALAAHTRWLWFKRAEVALPLVAIASAVIAQAGASWAGIVAAITIGLVAFTRIVQGSNSAEAAWYEARATAEAIKALAWRYAVRACDFDAAPIDAEGADTCFLDALCAETAGQSDELLLDGTRSEISAAMCAGRSAPLLQRRTAYVEGRLGDQIRWHADRARSARRFATMLDVAHYALDAIAIAAAIIVVAGSNHDLAIVVSVAAACAGAALTWSGVRRFSTVARQYSCVALALALLKERARMEDTEDEWRAFVDEVESTLAAEHAQWLASRGMSRTTR